jgi:prolyl oligopeptidase
MPIPDPRPTIAAPDDDPYLWLEEIDGGAHVAMIVDVSAPTDTRP